MAVLNGMGVNRNGPTAVGTHRGIPSSGKARMPNLGVVHNFALSDRLAKVYHCRHANDHS
jgi:hypothetical protein